MSSSASLLAGLVHGYADEKTRIAKEALDQSKGQQHMMLDYLGQLASSPNIPAEHQQWAIGKMQEIINAKPGGKLPKVDLNELPPVSTPAGPTRTSQPTLPAMTLQPPVGPGGAAATPSANAPAPSGDTGRASDSTVNALGNITPPVGPNSVPGYSGPMPISSVRPGDTGPADVPGSIVGMPDANGRPTLVPNTTPSLNAPISPVTLPAMPQAQVQNPMPPQQISAGGLHVLTPEDRQKFADVTSANRMEKLRSQFPDKSPDELAYYAQHNEFEKPSLHEVAPGGKLVNAQGKTIAENTNKKPGAKSGYSTKRGPSGEPIVVDNETGAELTPQEVNSIPEASTLMSTATAAHAQELQDARDKEDRHFQSQLDLQEKSLNNALKKADYNTAKKEVSKADDDYDAATNRMKVMDKNIEEAKAGDQQAMISLLTNHIGMTLGAQKGARISQTILNEAEQSAPWIGRVEARFDGNGYLSGVVLTPQQMDSMVKLAHEKADTLRDHANNMRDRYQEELHSGGVESKSKEHIKPAEASGQVTVTDPRGGVHVFPDQASADRFKAAIGGGK